MSNNRRPTKRRLDYELIESLVPDESRILDLGCGSGDLLFELCERKNACGSGIEIDSEAALACIRRGVSVYHGDMLEGMSHYRDGSFDVVILSQTLQQTSDPIAVICEMLRVGRTAIISFPNFGYWRVRLSLLFRGRMPVNDLLPYAWHNTPNVHLCTVTDFRNMCLAENLSIVREMFLVPPSRQISHLWANWRAGLSIAQIRMKG